MSVVAVFSVPASEFVLGRALREAPDLAVELERVVPVGTATVPSFWVVGEDRETFDAVLERESALTSFDVVDQVDDRALYRVEWDETSCPIVEMIATHDAVVQEAAGDADTWTFRLRFPDSHELSAFHGDCQEADVDLTVDRISNPIEPTTGAASQLTEPQRTLIEKAHELGYFDVPRKVTLAELSEEIGVSDQAVNERMRRGLSTLVETSLNLDGTGKSE